VPLLLVGLLLVPLLMLLLLHPPQDVLLTFVVALCG
jgi:hypothetical protein